MGDEIPALRSPLRRTPQCSLLLGAGGLRGVGGLRGASGAALTSRALLPQAAPAALQQRGARSPFLPWGARHLAHPRLQTPFRAAAPALVSAGAPLAPGPRLARFCGMGARGGDGDHAAPARCAVRGVRVPLTLALAGAGLRRGAGGALAEALAFVQVELLLAFHAEVFAEAALAAGRPALCRGGGCEREGENPRDPSQTRWVRERGKPLHPSRLISNQSPGLDVPGMLRGAGGPRGARRHGSPAGCTTYLCIC